MNVGVEGTFSQVDPVQSIDIDGGVNHSLKPVRFAARGNDIPSLDLLVDRHHRRVVQRYKLQWCGYQTSRLKHPEPHRPGHLVRCAKVEGAIETGNRSHR